MSVRQTQRDVVMERLADHLLANGLAATSLRQLAAAAGVSDRMLLYYFKDKAEVLSATLSLIASNMAATLAAALPEDKMFTPGELLQQAAAMTTQTTMSRFMRLWIQVVAAATKGETPFTTIAAQLLEGWQLWVESRLILPSDKDRRAVSLAIIAAIDGLALIDICAGKDAATQARLALSSLSA